MSIPKPDPRVYELAAEMIENKQTTYTCFAIIDAAIKLNLNTISEDMHLTQYQCMFGENDSYLDENNVEVFDPGLCVKSKSDGGKYISRRFGCKVSKSHPFWSKNFTEKRQQYRINALLLMAEMVRNP